MKQKDYEKAQRRYDAMEHPDYWNDDGDEYTDEEIAEIERKMEWDELSEDGRQRRHERLLEYADMRRKEIKEDAMIRSMKKEEGI
jgi:hypothetical protein